MAGMRGSRCRWADDRSMKGRQNIMLRASCVNGGILFRSAGAAALARFSCLGVRFLRCAACCGNARSAGRPG